MKIALYVVGYLVLGVGGACFAAYLDGLCEYTEDERTSTIIAFLAWPLVGLVGIGAMIRFAIEDHNRVTAFDGSYNRGKAAAERDRESTAAKREAEAEIDAIIREHKL